MTIPPDPAPSADNLHLIRQALSILGERRPANGPIEFRVPGPRVTRAGFFNNLDALAEEATRLDGTAPGLYVTLNPVNPQLLARAPNVVRAVRSGECTRDDDILEILWLPVDIDPVRPPNTSATDTELQHARDVRDALVAFLVARGWPAPLLAMSGNGTHALFRTKLPVTRPFRRRFQRALQALARRFDTAHAKVDVSVTNPSRIWKLYGTSSCKGEASAERPHRRSIIESVGDREGLVTSEQLQALDDEARSNKTPHGGATSFDLLDAVRAAGLYLGELDEGKHAIRCPWGDTHSGTSGPTETVLFEPKEPDESWGFKCLHAHCAERTIRDVLERLVPARDSFHLTDLGNARRLVAAHGQDLRHDRGHGWLYWDGTRWIPDRTGEVMRRAKHTAEVMGRTHNPQLSKHAVKSEARGRLEAMVALAESEPEIAVTSELFDRNPWLFTVENGTLDLRTAELRPHRREDFITKRAPCHYDPTAQGPRFEQFLEVIQPNAVTRRYVQKQFGRALTGDVRDQTIQICYGAGANGKSTLMEAVAHVLGVGGYAKHVRVESLLSKRQDSIPNDIAALRGARFVYTGEPADGRRIDVALVKQLTGGDTITARFLHREFFDFPATFKIFLATNHKPKIPTTDHATWRRIRLIPFTVTIPEASQDKQLKEKLLAEEGPAILRWLVEGCLAWQREGLSTPDEVKAATAEYQEEQDVFGGFIEELCDLDPTGVETTKRLYGMYTAWCRDSGERPMSKIAMGMELARRGFKSDRDRVARKWQGLTLRDLPSVPRSSVDAEIRRPQDTNLELTAIALTHEANAARKEGYDPGY